ncbi:KfrB domain-containing protein [Nitrosovibrio sp. Nv4]|uniref:KfrB domain-containing protein n=1 Tax=Nitrosovibrio sp. Nv4 TaxID=1945880 RepID=UPI0040408A68
MTQCRTPVFSDKAKTSIGVILHTDKDYVYQQDRDGKRVIRHALDAFDVAPPTER